MLAVIWDGTIAGLLVAIDIARERGSPIIELDGYVALIEGGNEVRPIMRRLVRIEYERCAACGRCIEACPQYALVALPGLKPGLVRDRCVGCMKCAESCEHGAIREELEKIGAWISIKLDNKHEILSPALNHELDADVIEHVMCAELAKHEEWAEEGVLVLARLPGRLLRWVTERAEAITVSDAECRARFSKDIDDCIRLLAECGVVGALRRLASPRG